MYERVIYPDDGDSYKLDGCITIGDAERLYQIAHKNNINKTNLNNVISFVIREYYKEHNIADYMTSVTGMAHKDYSDFLEKMRE